MALKFRSRDNQARRVIAPGGHIALVGIDWRELPEHLHHLALEAGCISSDQAKTFGISMAKGRAAKADKEITLEAVKGAMKTMLEGNDEENFTTSGMPNKAILSKMCSARIPAELYDMAFAELQNEAEQKSEPVFLDPALNAQEVS